VSKTPANSAAPKATATSTAAKASGSKPAVSSMPATRPSGRASAKAAARPTTSPGPDAHAIAGSAASRFADRFAPAKPTATRHFDDSVIDHLKPAPKADPKLANAWKNKPGRDLSEPELLAMPEDEYMNEKQLDFFRARLAGLKDDLLSNAGETTEHLREDTSIVPDPADRATIEEEHALELRTRDRERKLLKKIGQSLARVESGDYGYCDETGEPIGLARLLARPTATLSLEAQQRREMKQKMFGD
jgi:DnaK suppressor protein